MKKKAKKQKEEIMSWLEEKIYSKDYRESLLATLVTVSILLKHVEKVLLNKEDKESLETAQLILMEHAIRLRDKASDESKIIENLIKNIRKK